MRVVMLTPGTLPVPNVCGGAIQTLSTYILDENEMHNAEFEFLVLSIANEEAEKAAAKYKHSSFLFYKEKISTTIYVQFWRVLRKLFPNIVYVHQGLIHQFREEIKEFNPDCILIEGNYNQIKHANKFHYPVIYHLHTDLINKEVPHVQRIVSSHPQYWVISEFLKKRVEEVGGNNIKVFKNCIDTGIYVVDQKRNIRKELGIPETEKVLLYCGRVVPIKGTMELLKAFRRANISDMTLLIVGGSNFADSNLSQYVRDLHEYAKKYSLKVVFTGYVNPPELPAYYHAADFFAYPSICNEAAGMGIIEATCCGLSVITTNMGGIPEYIDKDRTILVDYDENLVEKLSEAIREQVSNKKYRKIKTTTETPYVISHGLETYYNDFCKLVKGALR